MQCFEQMSTSLHHLIRLEHFVMLPQSIHELQINKIIARNSNLLWIVMQLKQLQEDELNQLIDEQNKIEEWSDEEDLVSRIDFDDFEQRLHTSESFVREKPKPKAQQKEVHGPVSAKELSAQLQQNMQKSQSMRQTQQRQKPLSQTQQVQKQIPKPPEPAQQLQYETIKIRKRKSSVDGRASMKMLEQAQRDNQELLGKIQQLKKQIKQLEMENQELKRGVSSSQIQRSESAANTELRLLRMENEELKRVVANQGDQGRMLRDYGLQVAKLKCRIEDLQQKQ